MDTSSINFPGSGSLSGTGGTTLSSTGSSLPLTGTSSGDVLESSVLPNSNNSTSSSGVSLAAPMSIVEFSSLVTSATNKNNEVIYESEQFNDVKLTGFYKANVISALELVLLYQQLSSIAPAISKVFSDEKSNESTLNGHIASINSTLIANDNSHIATMNQAITDYQNGDITLAQYKAAVNVYNAYVASRSGAVATANGHIGTYNANVSTENNTIDTINTDLANLGFSTLSHQQTYNQTVGSLTTLSVTTPTTTHIPAVAPLTNSSLSITPDLSNSTTSGILEYFFAPIFDLVNGTLQDSLDQLKKMSTYQGFLQFINQSSTAGLPSAYTTPQPKVQNSGSAGGGTSSGLGGGSGVSLTSMITSLSNPLMASVIDSQLFNSMNTLLNQPLPPHLVDQMKYMNLSTLAQIGLSAGSSTARLLAGRLPSFSIESSPTALTLASAFSSQLIKASETPDFKDAITTLLNNAGVSAQNQAALAESLIAASKLFLLQVGIFQIGTALNNPNFSSQLLSTLESTRALATDQANQQITLQDVLNNPVSTENLKKTLTDQVVKDGVMQQQQAAAAISTAVNQAAASSTANSQQLPLYNALLQQGFSAPEAEKLSTLSDSYTKAEIAANYKLDTNVSAETLNVQQLVSALSATNIQQSSAEGAVKNTLAAGNFQTNRELRDLLSSELVAQGVSSGQALISSTNAVIPVSESPVKAQSLSLDKLNEQVSAQVVQQLSSSIGLKNAQAAAVHLTETIKDLRNGIDENIKVLQKQNSATVDNAVDNQIRSFLKPTLSLYTFNQELLDPARTLINMWSITTQNSRPSNFQKDMFV